MQRALEQILEDCANAQDLTDVNIAAGSILQDYRDRRRRSRARIRGAATLTLAAIFAAVSIGDAVTSSPVQPWHRTGVVAHLARWVDRDR